MNKQYSEKKLVHGVWCKNLFEELESEVAYAKTCLIPSKALYKVHGMISMAYQLEGLTTEEYLTLNGMCVRDGINNPKYF